MGRLGEHAEFYDRPCHPASRPFKLSGILTGEDSRRAIFVARRLTISLALNLN